MPKRMRGEFFLIITGFISLFILLGAGLTGYPEAYGQTTNLRFSTWHVPVSREVKTVWEPMLEELKKKSGGKIISIGSVAQR